MSSAALVEKLTDDPESPWVEWVAGKAITQRGVAKILDRYDIKSRTIRVGETKPRRDTFALSSLACGSDTSRSLIWPYLPL